MNKTKEEIEKLVAQNKLEEVIEILLEMSKKWTVHNRTIHHQIVLQASKFEQYKYDKMSGVMSSEQLDLHIANVRKNLLDIVDSLFKKNAGTSMPEEETLYPPGKMKTWQVATIIIFALGGLLAFGEVFNFINLLPGKPEPAPDISGIWYTNVEGLEYHIQQQEATFTWTIPGNSSGSGRIAGKDIYFPIGGREVHFFISKMDENGKPVELRSDDLQFLTLVLSRDKPVEKPKTDQPAVSKKTEPPSLPAKIMDISGIWYTNVEKLIYQIEQKEAAFTWTIPGAGTGSGTIKGKDIYFPVGGREIHFFASKTNISGDPVELKSDDPQFLNLVLSRKKVEDTNLQQPTKVLDISGTWKTNVKGLTYLVSQHGTQFTWAIPGGPKGSGRVEGNDIYFPIGDREIHFFVSMTGDSGRPIELKSDDPQYLALVLSR